LQKASGLPNFPEIFPVNRTRGVTNAGALGVFFIALRDENLERRLLPAPLGWEKFPDLDAPAWWLLKKKRTMYCDGGMAADSTRSMMQFLLTPDRKRPELVAAEPTWDAIRQFLLTIEAPKYPFPIDRDLAARGREIFVARCAKCHGTYGDGGTYPNKVVPIAEIGTDRARFDAVTDASRSHYNKTWFGEKRPARASAGYQAPPLDGVWATAPYFHNGSAPTLRDVLDSGARPKFFRLTPGRAEADYDAKNVGWKHDVPAGSKAAKRKESPAERRRTFDTSKFGNGAGGHRFGDALDDSERAATIEYLKTL
jgi:mono/diheme cytochrome c family protein